MLSMKEGKWLVVVAGVICSTLLGRLLYDICGMQHLDVVRSIFLGLCITYVMVPFKLTIAPVIPEYLGLAGAIGDLITQAFMAHR